MKTNKDLDFKLRWQKNDALDDLLDLGDLIMDLPGELKPKLYHQLKKCLKSLKQIGLDDLIDETEETPKSNVTYIGKDPSLLEDK